MSGRASLRREFPVRYFQEPRRGLNWARARGVRLARHEVVLLTDDDVVVRSNWVNEMRRPFLEDNVGAVTGAVEPLELNGGQYQHEQYSSFYRGFEQKTYNLLTLCSTFSRPGRRRRKYGCPQKSGARSRDLRRRARCRNCCQIRRRRVCALPYPPRRLYDCIRSSSDCVAPAPNKPYRIGKHALRLQRRGLLYAADALYFATEILKRCW